MKRLFLFFLAMVVGLQVMAAGAKAFTIEEGTFSLGGSSEMFIGRYDYDNSSDVDQYALSFDGGYFVMENLELGIETDLSFSDGDSSDVKTYSICPFIAYHLPVTDSSNVFFSAGGGYAKSEIDLDSGSSYDIDGTRLYSKIGWEYFFNPNVAVNIGVTYEKIEMDYDDVVSIAGDSETTTSFSTAAGLKVYF